MTAEHKIQVTQERELSGGMLSVTTTYRLCVTGDYGLRELDRLIRLLTLQKEFLEETKNEDAPQATEAPNDEAAASPRPDGEAEPSSEGGTDGLNTSEAA